MCEPMKWTRRVFHGLSIWTPHGYLVRMEVLDFIHGFHPISAAQATMLRSRASLTVYSPGDYPQGPSSHELDRPASRCPRNRNCRHSVASRLYIWLFHLCRRLQQLSGYQCAPFAEIPN